MRNEIARLISIISQINGSDISRYDDSFLLQTVKRRCDVAQTADFSAYLSYLSDHEAECRDFLLSLNNHYTEFFRNELTFAQLEHRFLPPLIEQMPDTREFRVWSAGCSTGQEAYSLAILLENIAERKRASFRYRIIATDILEPALCAARKGEYREEAVQNIRHKDLNLYFTPSAGGYTVSERLKKNVCFSVYDLFDPLSGTPSDSIFGNFDLVMCSNVLLYYTADSQRLILRKLVNSMIGNGYLVTGEAERSSVGKTAELVAAAPPSPIFKKRHEVRYEAE